MPKSLDGFKNVLGQLAEVHKYGMVHDDIRNENIIFNEEQNQMYLIDFDLANPEGTSYPVFYNSRLLNRHAEARIDEPMCIYHDKFSMSDIIFNVCGVIIPSEIQKYDCDKWIHMYEQDS